MLTIGLFISAKFENSRYFLSTPCVVIDYPGGYSIRITRKPREPFPFWSNCPHIRFERDIFLRFPYNVDVP